MAGDSYKIFPRRTTTGVHSRTGMYIHIYQQIHTHIHMYVYMYIYIERERERKGEVSVCVAPTVIQASADSAASLLLTSPRLHLLSLSWADEPIVCTNPRRVHILPVSGFWPKAVPALSCCGSWNQNPQSGPSLSGPSSYEHYEVLSILWIVGTCWAWTQASTQDQIMGFTTVLHRIHSLLADQKYSP